MPCIIFADDSDRVLATYNDPMALCYAMLIEFNGASVADDFAFILK